MATNPRIAPIERATQRSWDDWLRFMDAIGAADLDHGQIATAAGEPRLSATERRMHWRCKGEDGYAVAVASEPRTGGKASLVVTLTGLPSPESGTEARERWTALVTRFLGTP